jgi:lipopolysaccharide/colanic/teichoic acid biosynthesis glycosyltransferase
MVKPGISGWAQVRAGYAADLEETRTKLGYDLYYLKYFSFALDLQIMLRTGWTLVTGGGAR